MVHKLELLIANRVKQSLENTKNLTCSCWAEKYRYMGPPFPGKWTFNYHPWLLEMHDTDAERFCALKAAQTGYTETAINITFFNLANQRSTLYLLPTSDDASEFSSTRFNPALEASNYLQRLFTDVNNVRVKRAGSASLFIRGSRSRGRLKSIPTPLIILDERDEMSQEAVNLVIERQSGQVHAQLFELSTPTIANYGIHATFNISTQDYYMFKCPGCNRYINFEYPRNFVLCGDNLADARLLESYFKCHLCERKILFEEKQEILKHKLRGGNAHFISSYTDRIIEGQSINQMYSMARAGRPDVFAQAAMLAKIDPVYEQEFNNSKLALPHEASHARIQDDIIDQCIRPFVFMPEARFRTMGIDVGKVLTIIIYEWIVGQLVGNLKINDVSTPALVLATELDTEVQTDFDEVSRLCASYHVSHFVIDSEPEKRQALSLVQKHWGMAHTCDYNHALQGKIIIEDENEQTVKVNRTAWLDQALFRFRNKQIILSKPPPEAYRREIKAPVRVVRVNTHGDQYALYVNKEPDHFAHASAYAEVALSVCKLHHENGYVSV